MVTLHIDSWTTILKPFGISSIAFLSPYLEESVKMVAAFGFNFCWFHLERFTLTQLYSILSMVMNDNTISRENKRPISHDNKIITRKQSQQDR